MVAEPHFVNSFIQSNDENKYLQLTHNATFNNQTERGVDEQIDSSSGQPIGDHSHEDHHRNTPHFQPHDHSKHHGNHNFEGFINQTIPK